MCHKANMSTSAKGCMHAACSSAPLVCVSPTTTCMRVQDSMSGYQACNTYMWCLLQGSLGERVTSFFIGGAPCLRVEEVVYSPGDRFRLQTVSGGVVHLQIGELHCAYLIVQSPQKWRMRMVARQCLALMQSP